MRHSLEGTKLDMASDMASDMVLDMVSDTVLDMALDMVLGIFVGMGVDNKVEDILVGTEDSTTISVGCGTWCYSRLAT